MLQLFMCMLMFCLPCMFVLSVSLLTPRILAESGMDHVVQHTIAQLDTLQAFTAMHVARICSHCPAEQLLPAIAVIGSIAFATVMHCSPCYA